MGKTDRKFNAWVRANEKYLMFLMENPEKWEICKKILIGGNEDEAWENNPVRPILESYRKMQNLMEDDLEERIFEASSKFMPAE